MGTYYKPQSPIQSGEDFIYPITTADQIMRSDKSRRLEQAGLIVADNSTSLGGVAAKDYALKIDTAPDSSKLGGKSASEYALKTDTAPDSSKLSGKTLAEIMLALYPVGSIYMSVNSTSPASLFGGTWKQMKDRFLLGAGSTYSAGSTGGEAEHTLTVSEMPEHHHDLTKICWGGDTGASVTSDGDYLVYDGDSVSPPSGQYIGNTGGGNSHNNMPPYLAVYMWKRVS